MKLSKKVWLIVGVVILVAALISLYVVYSRQARERDALNDRLSEAQARLTVLNETAETLENQLAQAESLLNTSQAKFPESVESIEYGEYLFDIADDCNVNLASLSFPKPTAKQVGAVTYSVVSLSLPVSGTLDDIFEFIDTIRTDERFASADVKSVNIDVAGSATINLDIYGYKGT
jgi:hypothetical protein